MRKGEVDKGAEEREENGDGEEHGGCDEPDASVPLLRDERHTLEVFSSGTSGMTTGVLDSW